MNLLRELKNLIREVVSHGAYDTFFSGKNRSNQQRLRAEEGVRPDVGAHFSNFFAFLKRGARKNDDNLRDSLQDTANRVKEKAKTTKRKGGYK